MAYLKNILFVLFMLMLAGCGTGLKVAKDRSSGQACISDDANFANTALSPTQAFLSFQEVDGVPVKNRDAPVCLPPGKHKFKLLARTDLRKLDGLVELELKPDATYWLRAKLAGSFGFGNAFDFQLIDVADNKETIISEFSVPAEARTFEFTFLPGVGPGLLILPKN